jgi:hypothetical protein
MPGKAKKQQQGESPQWLVMGRVIKQQNGFGC